jgi:cyclic pyranopterin phosphate synthase
MPKFTHLNDKSCVHMVDVSQKTDTARTATAQSVVLLDEISLKSILENSNAKGNILTTVQIAAINATKQTSQLIPLCHNLPLTKVSVDIQFEGLQVVITVTASTFGKTGVEMEALTGASVAALTLYDMCKAINKKIVITDIKLLSKTGGKSGDFQI